MRPGRPIVAAMFVVVLSFAGALVYLQLHLRPLTQGALTVATVLDVSSTGSGLMASVARSTIALVSLMAMADQPWAPVTARSRNSEPAVAGPCTVTLYATDVPASSLTL